MTTRPWVSAGGKLLRCTDHPNVKPFVRGKAVCAECPPPGTTPVVIEEKKADNATAPTGCRKLDDRERRLTEMADHAWDQARGIAKDGKKSRPSQSLAIKWFAEGVKAERAAAELGAPRERKVRVKKLEKLAEELLHGRRTRVRGGSN